LIYTTTPVSFQKITTLVTQSKRTTIIMETYKGTVYPWQCDILEHLNVQFYVAKFDEAAWNFKGQLGFTPKYIKSQNKAVVSMEQHIKYFKQLVAGDLIRIETDLVEVRQKSIHYRSTMINIETEETAAEMDVIAVHIDTATREGVNFEYEVRQRLERLVG